jgi:hypothetical protein
MGHRSCFFGIGSFMPKMDRNIAFQEPPQFLCRKIAKIAGNVDPDIETRGQFLKGGLSEILSQGRKCLGANIS